MNTREYIYMCSRERIVPVCRETRGDSSRGSVEAERREENAAVVVAVNDRLDQNRKKDKIEQVI